ncbi:MAG: c-type cytochrome [Rhizobiaceae bacterium]
MKTSLKVLLAAAGMALASTAAHASADDIIKARQACMKAQGASMGVMVPMMKGEKPYDAAAIQAALDANGTACADWDKWWTAEGQAGATVKTAAKPEIWTDTQGFADAAAASYKAFTALKASTDEASFKAAFPAVGAACGSCHEKFRVPSQ